MTVFGENAFRHVIIQNYVETNKSFRYIRRKSASWQPFSMYIATNRQTEHKLHIPGILFPNFGVALNCP